MDVQELLSDSGIGREMHVIVGQGQLAAILESKPEERRAFIEEAAGVLKHRKRKEKALRKLDAMQANLTRLTDLTAELRRQLKPLGKQAEIARRAQAVQAELRDSRLRLYADDLVSQRGELAREEADEATARARRAEVEQALQIAQFQQNELEESLAADAPLLAAAQETWYRLSALEERLRGTVRLAVERARHLSASVAAPTTQGRDPDELDAEAEHTAEREAELAEGVLEAKYALAETTERRTELERAVSAAEKAHMAAVRAIADRREGLARLSGQVEALRSKTNATADEIERLSTVLVEATDRAELAAGELADARTLTGTEDSGDVDLGDRLQRAVEANDAAKARVEELVAAERTAEKDIASWKARVDALSLGLTRKDGAGALLAASDRLPGLLGSVAALLTVEPGAEAALAAALGPVADAVAVAASDDAVAALSLLRGDDSGRAGVLIGGGPNRRPLRLADAAAGRALGDRPGPGARPAARCRAPGARPARRRRRPARGAVPGGRPPRAARGHRGRRRAGRALGRRRLRARAERHRGAGRGRRGERQARRGPAVARALQRRAGGRSRRAAGPQGRGRRRQGGRQRGQGAGRPFHRAVEPDAGRCALGAGRGGTRDRAAGQGRAEPRGGPAHARRAGGAAGGRRTTRRWSPSRTPPSATRRPTRWPGPGRRRWTPG